VNPGVQGYADRLCETVDADALRRMADETASVARLVSHNATLRAALSDTAIPPAGRRAVLEELLADRVSGPTRRLEAFTVAAVSPSEVTRAASWLAVETARAAEGRRLEAPALGRSEGRQRVGGYAAALDEELSSDDLEEMEDALFRLARIIESTPPLRAVLTDRDQPAEARTAVVRDLLQAKVPASTRDLVEYVVRAGRSRDVVGTLDWLVERTAEVRGWRVARVHAAHEIDPEQRRELSSSLSRLAGAPVDLEVTVEPRLLGGVVVEIGDLLLDASARGRLDRLREHMQAGPWRERGQEMSGHGEGARE
jgi:F-type H+-transporting ATPase subunit delta